MNRDRSKAMGRRHLDVRFKRIKPAATAMNRPPKGWIKAIRQALGMSERQLARRLNVSQPTVADIERSEAAGRIQLNTLRRAAEALNCTVVYALVPNEGLETMVKNQTRRVAERYLRATEQSMRLEDQEVSGRDKRTEQLDAIAQSISQRALWETK
jgi:predicted DNA-binding mobile mystery protein A